MEAIIAILIVVGIPAAYFFVVGFVFKKVGAYSKEKSILYKSVLRGVTVGLLLAPSVIGTEGFGLPAPAIAALIALLIGANDPAILEFTFESLLISSLIASTVLFLKYLFVKSNSNENKKA